MEVWKRIKEFEDYEVSNYGNIRNGQKVFKRKKNKYYIQIVLYMGGRKKRHLLHRLVAEYFLDNPQNKKTVNHKDGNKHNNHVDNLEWSTHKEQINHADELGLRNIKGSKNHNSLLTEKQVKEIRAKYKPHKVTCPMLAKEYNVRPCTIKKVVYNLAWKHTL